MGGLSAQAEFAAGHAAQIKGDLKRAEQHYRRAAGAMPLEANHNLGVVLLAQGRYREAEACFRAAVKADPHRADPRLQLAHLKLGRGEYADAWADFEARRTTMGLQPPAVDAPEWKGEPLAGKRLLIVGEQGLGDQIMWARFLPGLAGDLTFQTEPSLVDLFSGLGVTVTTEAAGAYDYWTFLCSIGPFVGLTLESLPPPAKVWDRPLGSGGGIGVVPTGTPTHPANAQRSLFGADERRLLALGRDLRPEATGARTFAETAEIVAGLDLVITVDTSMAHLAGSMGKPTWVLLSAGNTDWRWLHERKDSPWYPSVRLFRQRVPGDWTPVFRQLSAALA